MRFYRTLPEEGAKRIITRFLFLPRRIEDETRWLEFVKIEQTWNSYFQRRWRNVPNWYDVRFLPYDPVKDCEIYKTKGCAHVDGILCDIEECNKK